MTTIESRIGKIEHQDQKVFDFLSDFRNFEHLIPQDKVSNWEATEDHCSFNISGIGEVGLRIVKKEAFHLIKYSGDNLASIEFNLWIQLKQIEETDTRVRITFKAGLNPMVASFAKKPLEEFVNILVNRLETYDF
jgi:carbon monoxide dehydrogenase subunit G